MKILSNQALRGPNYWSRSKNKLIQVRLECSKQEDLIIETKYKQLQKYFSDIQYSSKSHHTLADIYNQICLGIMKKFNPSIDFNYIQPTRFESIYIILFEYIEETLGKKTAEVVLQFLNQLIYENKEDISIIDTLYQQIEDYINYNKDYIQLMELVQKHHIPYLLPEGNKPLQLGYGTYGIKIHSKDYQDTIVQFQSSLYQAIPIIAVTGSNGKTTTTRLISHIIQSEFQNVGFTTSDGIYIHDEQIDTGDTTGPASAEKVLRDQRVDVAVLETARGGIVRAGLGFDSCDFAVITNVQDDHLGISDIETMEDLTRVKQVVATSVKPHGTVILNIDNLYTRKMGEQLLTPTAWFGIREHDLLRTKHSSGCPIIYVKNDQLFIDIDDKQIFVISIQEIPITFQGTVRFMIENVMAAVITCYLFGISIEQIKSRLRTFLPSFEQTPGRMNIFQLKDHTLMVDFAHNPDGFLGIRDYLQNINSAFKIGIIVATGDRKEEDIVMLGKLSAEMFDYIIIHQVKFLRGRTPEDLVLLLEKGIQMVNKHVSYERVADEVEPLSYALSIAKPNSYIVALSDVLNDVQALVKKYS